MRQPMGIGIGPIPEDKVVWYAARLGMDLVEQDAFEQIMRAVDVAYLTTQSKKNAKAGKRKS